MHELPQLTAVERRLLRAFHALPLHRRIDFLRQIEVEALCFSRDGAPDPFRDPARAFARRMGERVIMSAQDSASDALGAQPSARRARRARRWRSDDPRDTPH